MTPDAPTLAGPASSSSSAFGTFFNAPLSPLSDLSPSPPLWNADFAALQQMQPQLQLQPQVQPQVDYQQQQQQTPRPHAARTRQASGATTRPSLRLRDVADAAPPATTSQPQPMRRIRPLAPSSSNIAPAPSTLVGDAPRKGVTLTLGRSGSAGSSSSPEAEAPGIEFPPRGVVLHPDDASNKVLASMFRAFMSVVRALSS